MGPKSSEDQFQSPNSGTLYIVSTPIGNLEDITLRALRILEGVDLIAAESVKHSRILCRHYGIKTRLTSYNQHNQGVKGPELIEKLKAGLDIALVTNAGTPAVSDPGVLLIHQVVEKKIRISPIPGPSAVIAALSVSGLRADSFLFLGFLSNRAGKRRKELKDLAPEPRTLVFFEAPHRLRAMLRDIEEILGNRFVVLLREMTKMHEEVKRGSVSSILDQIETDRIRGECTLLVAAKETIRDGVELDRKIRKRIGQLLKKRDMSVKDIAMQLSMEEGVNYRKLYKECLTIKKGYECTPQARSVKHGVGREVENC